LLSLVPSSLPPNRPHSPGALRAAQHGLSAAAGKLGAVVGAAAFPWVAASLGLRGVFGACAAVCGLGVVVSELCIPDYDDGHAAALDEAHAGGTFLHTLYGPADGARESALAKAARRAADGHVAPAALFVAVVGTLIAAASLLVAN
jgi:hypothetical protein